MANESKATNFTADTSDLPEQYLDAQGRAFATTFDVLIVCNIIFHNDKVLLLKTGAATKKSWSNKTGVPTYRLARPEDENDVASLLRSRIDREMDVDVTVEEYGRVASRTQVGLDPAFLAPSSTATALHTAVSPAILEDSVWLRASLLWQVEGATPPVTKPDDYVCREVVWATLAEVEAIPSEEFLMSIKEDIMTAFELKQQQQKRSCI